MYCSTYRPIHDSIVHLYDCNRDMFMCMMYICTHGCKLYHLCAYIRTLCTLYVCIYVLLVDISITSIIYSFVLCVPGTSRR